MPGYKELKERHRAERDTYPENTSLRIHRALSWLDRAEQCGDDHDARFIFLWVAFNAAYANEIDDRADFTEQKVFRHFIERLVALDDETLYQLVWTEFSGSIRLLLDNRYVFGPFWEFQNGKISEEEWQRRFDSAKKTAHTALSRHRAPRFAATATPRPS